MSIKISKVSFFFLILFSSCVQNRIDKDISFLEKQFEQLGKLSEELKNLPHYDIFPNSETYNENIILLF
jgi:hypothetical protein